MGTERPLQNRGETGLHSMPIEVTPDPKLESKIDVETESDLKNNHFGSAALLRQTLARHAANSFKLRKFKFK
jgi:hypothetical protein